MKKETAKAEAPAQEKKYRKVGNLPSGEWEVENITTGEKKRASEFGDVTLENTQVP